FINNQPSTVSALRDLAPSLLDIHGQHEQQTLLDNSKQLALIDAYANSSSHATKVRDIFTGLQTAEAELSELTAEHSRKLERLDLLTFQHDEIQKCDPKPDETELLRQKIDILSNAGRLLEAARQ